MKRLIYLTLTILFNLTLYAQAPMQFNYQAVVRDGAGNALQSQNVAVTINILKGSPDGTLVFTETHNTSTNELGLVNIKIGSVASMESIDWGADDYFVMVLVNGNLMGISQLLSVPYAMHAKTAESVNRVDISNALEGQILRYDGNKFVNSQQQSLALDGSKLSISDGNTVNLPSSYLPMLTSSEILALTPQTGESVFNISQNHYQVYNGSNWVSIPANCWPQPTMADAGPNQHYVPETSIVLSANTPAENHGIAQWNIVSGEGGSFEDINNPNSLFTGQMYQQYVLRWSIETSCAISTDDVIINFNYWPTDIETEIVEVLNPATGKIWMDRNLGASRAATSSTDPQAYGDLYQWGRAADGHQKRTSGTTLSLSDSDTPGHDNFILPPSADHSDWRSMQNDNLWQGVNGTNNPCPAGFRLPTEAEFNTERFSWSSNDAEGAFSSPLKLAQAGFRTSIDGSVNDGIGLYWSGTIAGNYSRDLYILSTGAGMDSQRRSVGFSVRCIKYPGTPEPTAYHLNLIASLESSGTVNGSGEFEAGLEVPITATPKTGYIFVNWTGDTDHIADATAASTTLTMPAQNITLTANFEASGPAWPIDTETEVVDVTNPATGKTWMDRNLGASRAATSSTDEDAYGDLYQWGRAADGHQLRTSGTTSTLSNSDTPGHGNFILTDLYSPGDWRSPENDSLWQKVKNINNPCPTGYRLPNEAELDAERQSWNSNDANGAFGSPLKLTMAGGRNFHHGSLSFVGSFGVYWSSKVSSNDSSRLGFDTNSANMGIFFRASGFSVRCIKDD